MKKWLKYPVLVILLCFFLPGAGYAAASIKEGTAISGTVRVYLSSISQLTEADLTLSGSYTMGDGGNAYARDTKMHVANQGGSLVIQANGKTENVGTRMKLRRHLTTGENGIRIAQARGSGNLYPGDLEIRVKGEYLQIIVHVYMEDYLLGVLPYEMGNSFPLEALKAQAVAARTYALKKMSTQSSVYDLVDTTSDQVYNGTPSESTRCARAAVETAGVIGLVSGEYMATFFTASNGGQTETVQNAWGSSSYSYLQMKDDPYDLKNAASPAKSVSFYKDGTTSVAALTELIRKEAANAIGQSSVTVQGITDVRAVQPKYGSDSHVYKKIEIDLNIKGYGTYTLVLDYFSQVEGICSLSLNTMQNETLTVAQTVGGFKLTARRFGHGIGLSQRGAEQMANEGMSYDAILAFYYPGIQLTRFTLERTLLSSLDGTVEPEEQIINAQSAEVSLTNPLDSLNLRKSASLESAVLATISNGTLVTVLGESGDWSRIQYGTLSGYVKSEYLRIETSSVEDASVPGTAGTAVVSLPEESQILNLRAAPTTASTVVAYLRSGQRLQVLERYSKWTQVQYGTLTGYVMNEYILESSPESTEMDEETGDGDALEWEDSGDRVAIVLPGSGLNLRLSASLNSAVIMVLPQGTILEVRGRVQSGMLPVSIANISGFVSADLVYETVLSTPTPEPTSTPFRLYGTVNAQNGLILRRGPAQQADAVRLLPYGTEVFITGEAENGFFPVQVGSDTGYVSQTYLSIKTESKNPEAYVSVSAEAVMTPELPEEFTPLPGPTPSPVPPASHILSGENAYVNASTGLNLRSGPSADSDVIAVLGYQVQVIVLGEAVNGFYPVRAGTLTGYLSADYVTMGDSPMNGREATAAPTPTPFKESEPASSYRVVVNSSNGLNLREQPNTSSSVVYVLPYGMVLTVLDETESGFLHVKWDNYEGYVSSEFVSPIGEN